MTAPSETMPGAQGPSESLQGRNLREVEVGAPAHPEGAAKYVAAPAGSLSSSSAALIIAPE
jgi:hypothetical protein